MHNIVTGGDSILNKVAAIMDKNITLLFCIALFLYLLLL